MRHLDGRDLRSGEHDEVGEDASDAGGVADAEEALLFAFAVDYNGFEADTQINNPPPSAPDTNTDPSRTARLNKTFWPKQTSGHSKRQDSFRTSVTFR